MKRSVFGIVGMAAALAALAGCRTPVQRAAGVASPVSLPFEAKFETAGDFYDRFDFGYSGQNPFDWPVGEQVLSYHGDHDMNCGGPTTSRPVAFGGDQEHLDFSQLFWHCAPGGDRAKGHLMTGVNTTAYNIAWFSPKPEFSAVSKVCWDVNETTMSRRKWTQVVFVPHEDAVRYPVGSPGPPTRSAVAQTRGSGGFDLGYVSPEFADPAGVSTNIISTNGSQAGFKTQQGGTVEWWQGGNFTFQDIAKPLGIITDKAARYTHCLEQTAPGTITFTQQTPSGPRVESFAGQIPQGPVRVVFQDDNYNPPKDSPPENLDGTYDPNAITWHWDNIQIHAGSASSPPPPP